LDQDAEPNRYHTSKYLADHHCKASSNTLNVTKTEGQLLFTLNVRVENTQDVLEIVSAIVDETHAQR